MAVTITLKDMQSGQSFTLDVLDVKELPEVKKTQWTAINNKLMEVVEAEWKKFEIRFAYLSLLYQNAFENLVASTAGVQFTYNAVTYDVRIDRYSIRAIGGSMTVINVEPE